jgi:hypothetical protein
MIRLKRVLFWHDASRSAIKSAKRKRNRLEIRDSPDAPNAPVLPYMGQKLDQIREQESVTSNSHGQLLTPRADQLLPTALASQLVAPP